jgi:hypothetical protein
MEPEQELPSVTGEADVSTPGAEMKSEPTDKPPAKAKNKRKFDEREQSADSDSATLSDCSSLAPSDDENHASPQTTRQPATPPQKLKPSSTGEGHQTDLEPHSPRFSLIRCRDAPSPAAAGISSATKSAHQSDLSRTSLSPIKSQPSASPSSPMDTSLGGFIQAATDILLKAPETPATAQEPAPVIPPTVPTVPQAVTPGPAAESSTSETALVNAPVARTEQGNCYFS